MYLYVFTNIIINMKPTNCYCGCGKNARAIGIKVKVPLHRVSCENTILMLGSTEATKIENSYWNDN